MSAKQNYLRAIYKLTDAGDKGTTTGELSEELGVSNASVSETIKKLEDDKLICRAPYKEFTLSPMGKEEAERIKEKYDILRNFFEDLGLEHPEKEADTVEHSISMEAVKKIEQQL
ncbi:metal-dependent transcriptional regulator [Candidatus Nanohalovita haloferacivicina]|uniref:metal-dependent transcriptional regulator n=1 Tax=Candidatus Nanohalovita haloferacivicina TaxID=2978046 RepID=UPI00325FA045|nr:DtxR family transcriptional regulator, Mn-dependent transcriptional regulator [Candidatus Nanohalobia archaeon BNXNv]